MAGCTGLEFSRGDLASRATTHANSSIRSRVPQVRRTTDFRKAPRQTPQFRRSLGDILETDLQSRLAPLVALDGLDVGQRSPHLADRCLDSDLVVQRSHVRSAQGKAEKRRASKP